MRMAAALLLAFLSAGFVAMVGCRAAPGKPGPEPEVPRPDQVLDFATLYRQNCVACHGDDHQPGAAISLANPVFLAIAGEGTVRDVLKHGVPGKLMPAFAESGGGMLTDEQVEVLVKGLMSTWGKPGLLDGQKPPPYQAVLHPVAAAGLQSYATYCARCHGPMGAGSKNPAVGSIVDPTYLALVSDQELRNFVVAGFEGMPDWRSDSAGHPMTDEDVTSIVAWLGSHRDLKLEPTEAAPQRSPGPEPRPVASAARVTHKPTLIR